MRTNGGYGKGRPRFTDEQRRDMTAAWDSGESAPSIAKRYGCSPNTVYNYLRGTVRYQPQQMGQRIRDDATAAVSTLPGGTCIRCGIQMGIRGMCIDCLEVEGSA